MKDFIMKTCTALVLVISMEAVGATARTGSQTSRLSRKDVLQAMSPALTHYASDTLANTL